jgi:hypothetical protein
MTEEEGVDLCQFERVSGVKPAILKGQADPVEGCSVLRGQPTAKGRLRRESVSDRYRECEASACTRLEKRARPAPNMKMKAEITTRTCEP